MCLLVFKWHSSSTAMARTTTTTSTVTSNGHHLHNTNSIPVSTDVTYSVTESISPPSATGNGIDAKSQGNIYSSTYMHKCNVIQLFI